MARSDGSHEDGADLLPVVDAVPKGPTVDVRVFFAALLATVAVSFAAGFLYGPAESPLLDPVRSLLGAPPVPPPPPRGAARGMDEKDVAGAGAGGVASEFAVAADGEVVEVDAADAATVRKIKETHVNIDTPVLEGTAEDLPFERDIRHGNSSSLPGGGKDALRDQTHPTGQHLLVDMKNLEADFLNSERRLVDATLKSVAAGGLTLLSYHCHSLHPAGVSCVGVLLESHISFHTWPDEGVITLDLFTTSEQPLLPALPKLEEYFGVPRKDPATGEDAKVRPLRALRVVPAACRSRDARSFSGSFLTRGGHEKHGSHADESPLPPNSRANDAF